jgi:hypothetical protein
MVNRILANEGVVDALGHVSLRHPEDAGRYLLSCSCSPALVTEDDTMEFDLDSNPLDQRSASCMRSARSMAACRDGHAPQTHLGHRRGHRRGGAARSGTSEKTSRRRRANEMAPGSIAQEGRPAKKQDPVALASQQHCSR